MKSSLKLIIFLLSLYFIINTVYTATNTVISGEPTWITQPNHDKEYLYVVGYTEDIGSFEEIKDKALQNAKGKIANTIFEETTVDKVFTTSGSLNDNETLRKSYQENVKSQSAVNLSGVELIDTYKEENKDSGLVYYKVWVLSRISNKNLERERNRILSEIQRKLALVDNSLKVADQALDSGKISDAVNSYLTAAISSTRVKERTDEFPIYINKAGKVLENTFIEAYSNTNIIDTAKGGSFSYRVFYSSEKGKIPAGGLKISFVLRNNDGDYSRSAVSDDNGIVICTINKLKEVNNENRLYALLNIDFQDISDLGKDYQTYSSTLQEKAGKISVYSEFKTISEQNRTIPIVVIAILKSDDGLKQLPNLASEAQSFLIDRGYKVVNFSDTVSLDDISQAKKNALDKLSVIGIKRAFVLFVSSFEPPKYDETLERYLGVYSVSAQLLDTSSGEILSAKNIKISATSISASGVFDSFIKAAGKQIQKLVD